MLFPDKNLILSQIQISVIHAVVVAVVVEPPVAVRFAVNRPRAQHAPAPNVPARAPEGICTHESSS